MASTTTTIQGEQLAELCAALRSNPVRLKIQLSDNHGLIYQVGGGPWSPEVGTTERPPRGNPELPCEYCGYRIFWDSGKRAWNLLYKEHGNDTTVCTRDGEEPGSTRAHLPISRTREMFILTNLPREFQGWQVIEAGTWSPGDRSGYAGAKVVFHDDDRAKRGMEPFAVAMLYYNDQAADGTAPWIWHQGNYSIATLERAREIARKS